MSNVPRAILITSIIVTLLIHLIMFLLIRDEIIQSETIVSSYEIDGTSGSSEVEDVIRASDTGSEV